MEQMQDKVEIDKDEYIKLRRLENYVYNWYPDYKQCKVCGAYHPKGSICIECRKDLYETNGQTE